MPAMCVGKCQGGKIVEDGEKETSAKVEQQSDTKENRNRVKFDTI